MTGETVGAHGKKQTIINEHQEEACMEMRWRVWQRQGPGAKIAGFSMRSAGQKLVSGEGIRTRTFHVYRNFLPWCVYNDQLEAHW
jgi:hypothetical protein